MKEYLKDAAIIVVSAVLGGFVAAAVVHPANLAGDFPGGNAPSQLLTANVAGGYP